MDPRLITYGLESYVHRLIVLQYYRMKVFEILRRNTNVFHFSDWFCEMSKVFCLTSFHLIFAKNIFLNNRRLRRSYRVSEIQLLWTIQIIPDNFWHYSNPLVL